MTKGYFEAPVFEIAHGATAVDIARPPFFYNGKPAYRSLPPPSVTPLTPVP